MPGVKEKRDAEEGYLARLVVRYARETELAMVRS